MKKIFKFLSAIAIITLLSCGSGKTNTPEENYEKIETDMTYKQVINILGEADTISKGYLGELGSMIYLGRLVENLDELGGLEGVEILGVPGYSEELEKLKELEKLGKLSKTEIWHYQLGDTTIDITIKDGKVTDKSLNVNIYLK